MIAVVQRILSASVIADGEPYSECGKGFLVLLGVSADDDEKDAKLLADKISKMRVFEDSDEKMNLSVNGAAVTPAISDKVVTVNVAAAQMTDKIGLTVKNGEEIVHTGEYSVRQYAETILNGEYDDYIKDMVPSVAKGKFQSDMKVSLVNDGPVTISMDSRVLKGEREL